MAVDRSEIAFFDLETIPDRTGQKWKIIEFGAILVCPQKLVELDKFSILIRPADLSLISETRVKSNGITFNDVAAAPKFEEVAKRIYDLLDGRVWAGHNILRCDCVCIREAFSEIGWPAPKAKEYLDSFPLFEQKFRRRAGDMKMATLAEYFGLGRQTHRSLDDVRMNLEVLKCCATVLFLENFSKVLPVANSSRGASTSTSLGKRKASTETVSEEKSKNLMEPHEISTSSPENSEDENLGIFEDPCNVVSVSPSNQCETKQSGCAESEEFLEPHEISTSSLRATFVPSQWGTPKIKLLHKGLPFGTRSINMMIRYGISKKFLPRLSFVVEPSSETCNILKDCDDLAQNLSSGRNDKSEWRPLVTTKPENAIPAIRIHIQTAGSGETATYSTELYERDSKETTQWPAAKTVDINELEELFVYGRSVDADYNFDIYDYPPNAGIRLVARRLTVDLGC